jgi:hypothetical protein
VLWHWTHLMARHVEGHDYSKTGCATSNINTRQTSAELHARMKVGSQRLTTWVFSWRLLLSRSGGDHHISPPCKAAASQTSFKMR